MAEEYVIMPKSDYVSACDAIRRKTGKTGKIKSCDLCTEIDCITDGSTAGGSNGSVDSEGAGGSGESSGSTGLKNGVSLMFSSTATGSIMNVPHAIANSTFRFNANSNAVGTVAEV